MTDHGVIVDDIDDFDDVDDIDDVVEPHNSWTVKKCKTDVGRDQIFNIYF